MGASKQVNPSVATETIPDAPGESAQGTAGHGGLLENWLDHHINAVAIAIVAAGFAFRIFTASQSYLNPDEALHYLLTNQHSLWLAYKASLTNAHPPLMYVILYFWRFLGHSELMLRLPSVIMGTAFCWILYKWIGVVFGRTAGLIGLILAAFSPALIALSAEIRQYAVLLFCMICALYFLALALEEKSVRKMWYFSGFLYLAILSHYSAVFFTVAVGVYALARLADSRPPWKLVVAWAGGQAMALGIYIFLYVTHVSKIRHSIALWAMPFDTAYFHVDQGNIFTFTKVNTLNIFIFLFGQRYVAMAMLLFFVAGVAFLFGRDLLSPPGSAPSSRLGILVLLPFIAVWGASIAGIYPYVGSRHTVFLAPFIIAGVSYLLAAVSPKRLWPGLLVAALLMTVANSFARPLDELEISSGNHRPAIMAAAVNYMEHTIPPGDLILVDYQSSLQLSFYLCGPKNIIPIKAFRNQYLEFSCKGYPVISLQVWKLIAQGFPRQFQTMARDHGLHPGERVWVYQSGWGPSLGTDLAEKFPKFRCLTPKTFGGTVTVTPFFVGPDFLPAPPSQDCP
jgi:4-amino-4-deoxy-L-arabinose transferase-like glycosyltransferase